MFKKIFSSFLFLIFIFTSLCYGATVPVTEANLNEALQNVVASEAMEKKYEVSMTNGVINITSDNENYTLNYSLADKPTFSSEILIEEGMSYADFQEKTENGLFLPMMGYGAVANIQGVKVEDAIGYFMLSYLGGALSGSSLSSENLYVIIDDLNVSEGVTIEKTDDPNTIYASEFGDRVMEYVNEVYAETHSISDAEAVNSYLYTIERQDVTETSCKLVATLTVNLDVDFSIISKYMEQLSSSSTNDDITKENADYVINLKTGQKCKFETSESITGYEAYGNKCIEFSEDRTEITAISAGEMNGYLYIGDIKKSYYAIVEENPENETLETITLKLEKTSEDIFPDESVDEDKQEEVENNNTNTEESNNNVTDKENSNANTNQNESSSSIPKTGIDDSIFLAIITFIILMFAIGLKLKKYSDIK